MRATSGRKAIFLSGALLLLGCASGGGGHSSPTMCQDRSRFGVPERLSPEQIEEARSLVSRQGAPDPELIPVARPDLLNRGEVASALVREYPPGLRDRGISGTVHVILFIAEVGGVERAEVSESAGTPTLDQAAVRVAQGMHFSGSAAEGRPICYVMTMPVTFTTR